MARLPELMEFRNKHGLRICTIQSLIAYRRKSEKLVELEQIVKLPTDYGDFDLHLYRSKVDGQHHLALVKGRVDKNKPTLVRVHSQCLTGDVFASRRCDCGNQLHAALRQIEEEGQGVLVYMSAFYLIVFSIGEAFYSPRVYEYAAAIAPPGQEASYGSLAYLPFLVGKLLVGTGGWLLAAYVPEHGPRHPGTMWLIFALAASIAPIGLILFRSYIRVPEAGRQE